MDAFVPPPGFQACRTYFRPFYLLFSLHHGTLSTGWCSSFFAVEPSTFMQIPLCRRSLQLSHALCSWHSKSTQLTVHSCYCHIEHFPFPFFIICDHSGHFPQLRRAWSDPSACSCRNPCPGLAFNWKTQLLSKTSLWEMNTMKGSGHVSFLGLWSSGRYCTAPFSRSPSCRLLPSTGLFFQSCIQQRCSPSWWQLLQQGLWPEFDPRCFGIFSMTSVLLPPGTII